MAMSFSDCFFLGGITGMLHFGNGGIKKGVVIYLMMVTRRVFIS